MIRRLSVACLVLTLAAPQAALAAQKETQTVDRTVSIGQNGTLDGSHVYADQGTYTEL